MAHKKKKRIVCRFSSGKYLVSIQPLLGMCVRPSDCLEIIADPRQPEPELLNTLLHEALHAEETMMSEEDVARIASAQARLLWKAGYRRKLGYL
jgi:hypothetical protein